MSKKLFFVIIIFLFAISKGHSQSSNKLPLSIRLQTLFIMDKLMSDNLLDRENILCQLKNMKEEDSYIDTLKSVFHSGKTIYIVQFTFDISYSCDSHDESIIKSIGIGKRGAFHRPTVAMMDKKLYRITGFNFNDKNHLLESFSFLNRNKLKRQLKKLE